MKHIAIITSGMVGITNACLKLASRLKEEGYKITILCPIDIKENVERQGISYKQLPQINFKFSFLNTSENVKNDTRFKKHIFHLTHLKTQYTEGVNALRFQEYEDILKGLHPDMALIDQEIHEAILTCLKLKIDVKLLGQFFSNIKRKNLPPIRTHIIPKKNTFIRYFIILWAWLKIKLKIFGRFIINNITLKSSRRSIIKHFIRIHRLKVTLISRNFPSVFIYKNIPILSMTVGELDFPHKRLKSWTYIGAMVFDKRLDSEIPSRLQQVFDKKRSEEKKLIYCSLTTMQESGDINFINHVIEAVKAKTNWLLIISLGGRLSVNSFQNVPEHVYIFNWVPQLKVLEHADCSINHGGIHTINECIHFSVPMLIYSGKRFDQNGCAARMVYHNLGLSGDKDIDTVETIRAKINNVLNDETFQKNIEKTNLVYKQYIGKQLSSYL